FQNQSVYGQGFGGGYGLPRYPINQMGYGLYRPHLDLPGAAFRAADYNHDGVLDRSEFRRFASGYMY
ncbi:unnamed protein product, partial [Didymodactylos carnosus]